MSIRPCWRDAQDVARSLERRERDLWTLLTLAQLPFVSEEVLEQLAGVSNRGLHRTLLRLLRAGVVAGIAPPLRAGHSSRLLYLTDLGVSALSILYDVEPEQLARRLGIASPSLIRLTPRLSALQNTYRLLGAIAAFPPPGALARVERPWKRSGYILAAKAALRVELPALADFLWTGHQLDCLLIADAGELPLRFYRVTVDRLVRLRALQEHDLPVLVVATDGKRRAEAWERMTREVTELRREAPLNCCIASWSDLAVSLKTLTRFARQGVTSLPSLGGALSGLPRLETRPTGRPLPSTVGLSFQAKTSSPGSDLAKVAVELSPCSRELLNVIGRHPFLSQPQLSALVDRSIHLTRRDCRRIQALDLIRVVEPEEVRASNRTPRRTGHSTDAARKALTPEAAGRLQLVELTGRGAELLAAGWGVPTKAAQRLNALVGGGPHDTFGPRIELMRQLAHTVETNEVFVRLVVDARRLLPRDGQLDITWRSAADCARGRLRPDGYVMLEDRQSAHGFFVEYDRATESRRDYRRKLAAYHDCYADGRFRRDYDGFPTVLVVTTSDVAEQRIAESAHAAAVGRDMRLAVLLTTEWRIRRDPRNPNGWFGVVWREAESASNEVRRRTIGFPQQTGGSLALAQADSLPHQALTRLGRDRSS